MSKRPALAACVAAIAAIAAIAMIAASVPAKAAPEAEARAEARAEAETTPFRIAGSDSMLPFLELLGREQAKRRPGFELEVSGRGSTTGPPMLLRGQAELASMTRALNATESAAFQARYQRAAIAFTVALDAVALYVNVANPLTRAGLDQVDAIFSASPRCGGSESFERWGQLGAPLAAGDFADRRIGLYAPADGSGTRTVFRDLALCGAQLQRHTRALPGTRSVSRAVAESRYAIGVGTLAGTAPRIRALALPSSDGSGFAVPTPGEVRSGRYPFSRELLLVAAPAADGSLEPSARAFLALALSDTGQRIAEAAGFVALTPEGLVRERARLDAASH